MICVLEQHVKIVGVVGVERDANAGRDEGFVCAQFEWLGQLADDGPGDLLNALRVIHIGQDDGELIAAKAGDRIRLAHARADALAGLDQQRISPVMPERVVDLLEAVEIDQHQRHAPPDTAWLTGFLRESLVEHLPIWQARQCIEIGLFPDGCLKRHAVGEITTDRQHGMHIAGLVGLRREADVRALFLPILAVLVELSLIHI